MSKEFTIPPVIFPSGGNPNLIHRRVPTAPFSPPAPPNNFSRPIRVPAPTPLSDPPLLEELGINAHQIWTKARPIFNPFKTRTSSIHSDPDLSGPSAPVLEPCGIQLVAACNFFGGFGGSSGEAGGGGGVRVVVGEGLCQTACGDSLLW
ncbi:hypothetical protein RJ641_025133 [Dillenia turbinata]|uniref:Uncharacterized protein n=1 Tax=Dillenia turbinata TaxID=194707 RepID=A0AAN8W8U3_9MAGN